MGDGQRDGQQLSYRLSKGLHNSYLSSGDQRDRSLPAASICAACAEPIRPGAATMWLEDQPYHVRCGRAETERRDAAARAERERRFRS